jgi:dipeptidyl aminopeptidase/acylaminoacyl peptidase
MLGMGRMLAHAGYRVVLIDHRGHGRSSGDWMTYGAVESRDLVQVLDALTAQGLAGEAIGVLGFSYGGAIAIQLAAVDPRVRAVIAVAAFASLEEVVPVYVRRFFPAWIIPDGRIADAVEQAGAIAGFDPADASPIDAIARTAAHVLLIHGREDAKIPFSHSERMQAATGERALLVLVDGEGHDSLLADGEGHDSLLADEEGVIARWSLEWFGRWLGE